MAQPRDTIVAVATGPAAGPVGILRLSGPASHAIAASLSGQPAPPHRQARYARLLDAQGAVLDSGLLLAFAGPASFTGEDVVELQVHGNPLLLARIQARCCELGARPAEPGEFSLRAFDNGKLDLAQAEAIADLIAAGSESAARAAQHSLQGAFSRRCDALATDTLGLRALLEAWLDFPEEDIGDAERDSWASTLATLSQDLATLRAQADQGLRLTQGLDLVIVGAPNAGKSTLLNALARREVAIVSDIQGTTRDLLSAPLVLNGVPVRVTDSAGLRAGSADPIEREGIARAERAAAQADRILALDAADAPLPPLPEGWAGRVLRVRNKLDLDGGEPGWRDGVLHVCARDGRGLDLLAAAIAGQPVQDSAISARQRHVDALRRAAAHLEAARPWLAAGGTLELAAEELRLAHQALGEITGRVEVEDLLGQIFSTFCIGK